MGILSNRADERVRKVSFDAGFMRVDLADGRTLQVPLKWYPRLAGASPAQLSECEIIGEGLYLHWPVLDEDLSVEGLLRGAPAPPGAREETMT